MVQSESISNHLWSATAFARSVHAR